MLASVAHSEKSATPIHFSYSNILVRISGKASTHAHLFYLDCYVVPREFPGFASIFPKTVLRRYRE